MLTLQRFDFHENLVRVVMIDGEPWWFGADVCRALALQNPTQALARLDEDEVRYVERVAEAYAVYRGGLSETEGQTQNTPPPGTNNVFAVISESGLYSLILTSRRPEAKVFKRWVTREVLPTIRKTGRYEAPGGPCGVEDAANMRVIAEELRNQPVLARCTVIRTADLVYKNPALMPLWDATGLPRLPFGPLADVQADRAADVLQKIALAGFNGRTIKDWLAEAIGGSEQAAEALRPLGFILITQEEAVAIANATFFLRRLFKDEPFWRDLRGVTGARPYHRLWFGRLQSRATLIPLTEIELVCAAVYEGLTIPAPEDPSAA